MLLLGPKPPSIKKMILAIWDNMALYRAIRTDARPIRANSPCKMDIPIPPRVSRLIRPRDNQCPIRLTAVSRSRPSLNVLIPIIPILIIGSILSIHINKDARPIRANSPCKMDILIPPWANLIHLRGNNPILPKMANRRRLPLSLNVPKRLPSRQCLCRRRKMGKTASRIRMAPLLGQSEI